MQLDLEDFGKTRITVQTTPTGLCVNFFVEHPEAVRTLRGELPTLREALQAIGFRKVLLSAGPLSGLPPEATRQFTELRAGVPADVHLLDVRA